MSIFVGDFSTVRAQGNFLPGINYPVGAIGNIALGDFNGDGKLDLVVANMNSTVGVLLGNGDGTFGTQQIITSVPGTSNFISIYVAVGDFNGDGIVDLAVLNANPPAGSLSSVRGSVSILLGNGDATFAPPTTITLPGEDPTALVVADFNGDKKLDLAVLNFASDTVSVLLGNGNSSFQSSVEYATPTQRLSLTAGDLNGDGYPDLVLGGGTAVAVLLANRNGTFQAASSWITTTSGAGLPVPSSSVIIGDFNHDGKPDLAVDQGAEGGVAVLLGNGDGTFQAAKFSGDMVGLPGQSYFAVGDFNGDGKLDLAKATAIYPPHDDLQIYLGKGDGTFQPALVLLEGNSGPNPSSEAVAMVSADFNSDNYSDLAIGTVSVFPGTALNVTVVMNCGTRCTTTSLTSPATSVFNQLVSFAGSVTPSSTGATGTPTGSVSFLDVTTTPGTTLGVSALSGGKASFSTVPNVGTHSIVASYSGDANFDQSESPLSTLTVSAAPTSISIGSSLNPSNPGQTVTVTAQVNPATSGLPTGTVTFADNGTAVVALPLNSGSQTFTTSSLAAGTHSITWSYSGDANFAPSTSAVLSQVIGTSSSPFAMAATCLAAICSPPSVLTGQSAAFTISITPLTGFNGNVSLSCSGLPALATCNFAPASVTPQGKVVTSSLMIGTTGTHSALYPLSFHDGPGKSSPSKWANAYVGALAVILCWGAWNQKLVLVRCRWRTLALLVSLGLLSGGFGCGGNGSAGSNSGSGGPTSTPAGNYSVVVTATSGTSTQTVPIALTVLNSSTF
jgi:hypothetical protein